MSPSLTPMWTGKHDVVALASQYALYLSPTHSESGIAHVASTAAWHYQRCAVNYTVHLEPIHPSPFTKGRYEMYELLRYLGQILSVLNRQLE